MRLHLVDRRQDRGWRFSRELMAVLKAVCEPAGQPHWDVGVVLVDDTEIGELNRNYRDDPEATDVLSFSYLDEHGSGRPALRCGEHFAGRDLWRDDVEERTCSPVGEIILSPAFIRDRCNANRWPYDPELAMLTAHGVLHILGWRHDDRQTTAAMRAKEEELLRLGGLVHPLRERG